MPPTSFTSVILDRALEPSYRSRARLRARRTRLSSNGFFSWCIDTKLRQFHGEASASSSEDSGHLSLNTTVFASGASTEVTESYMSLRSDFTPAGGLRILS